MPKLQIRQFKGIYSDIDQTDRSLDYVKDALNMRFENTYCQTEASLLLNLLEAYIPDGAQIEAVEEVYLADDRVRNDVVEFSSRKGYVVSYLLGGIRTISYQEDGWITNQPEPATEGQITINNTNGIVYVHTPDGYHILQWLRNKPHWTKMSFPKNNKFIDLKITQDDTITGEVAGFEFPNDISNDNPILHYDNDRGFFLRLNLVNKTTGVTIRENIYLRFRQYQAAGQWNFSGNYFDLYMGGFWESEAFSDAEIIYFSTIGVDLKPEFTNIYDDHFLPLGPNDGSLELDALLSFRYDYNVEVINSTTGFDANRLSLLMTYVLDEKTEVIVSEYTIDASSTSGQYGISFLVDFPNYQESRITKIVIYGKEKLTTDEEDFKYKDYEELHSIDLLADDPDETRIVVTRSKFTGVTLSQNIGLFYDPEKYEWLDKGIEANKKVDGISYAVSKGQLYGSVVGRGQVLDELFYTSESLPLFSKGGVRHIANVNNTLGVFTNEAIHFLSATNSEGAILYSIKDSATITFKNYKDVVETADGIFMLTPQGIFLTNGYDMKLISLPINDIIEEYYQYSSIFFTKQKEKLYYYNGIFLYRYDLTTQTWSKFTTQFDNLKWMSEDIQGNVIITTELGVYKIAEQGLASGATLDYGTIDLGDSSAYKLFTTVLLDCEVLGKGTNSEIILDINGTEYLIDNNYINQLGRVIMKRHIPVGIMRKPRQLLDMKLIINNLNLKIYNFEVYYDLASEGDIGI